MSNSGNTQEISQPMPGCSHYQKLMWLQKRRTEGLWVLCDDCNRWRYLPNILDKHQLSKKWYCNMNPDRSKANCSEPEVPIYFSDLEDLIHSEYAAGSLVIGLLPGWPWWPAMVDDCPDTEQYYWLDGFSDIPTHYNVVFFDAHGVTRAWLAPEQLKPYAEGQIYLNKSLQNKTYHKRLRVAIEQADDAEILPLKERLAKYSFITKYRGKILSPKKISRKEAQKYIESFKRKYNVDLPFESSDSEEDVVLSKHAKTQNYNNNEWKSKNDIVIESNTEITDDMNTLVKVLSVSADVNNNVETIKDSFTNVETTEQLKSCSVVETLKDSFTNGSFDALTPPSDDFDFKM